MQRREAQVKSYRRHHATKNIQTTFSGETVSDKTAAGINTAATSTMFVPILSRFRVLGFEV